MNHRLNHAVTFNTFTVQPGRTHGTGFYFMPPIPTPSVCEELLTSRVMHSTALDGSYGIFLKSRESNYGLCFSFLASAPPTWFMLSPSAPTGCSPCARELLLQTHSVNLPLWCFHLQIGHTTPSVTNYQARLLPTTAGITANIQEVSSPGSGNLSWLVNWNIHTKPHFLWN